VANKLPPIDAKGLTTPFGMLRYAEEYRRAAELVHQQDELLMPAHTLLGLTYELATKAYLLGRGMSVEVLSKRPYGHDLEELWNEAMGRRIDRLVALAPIIGDVVATLNIHYKTHEFRYIKTGTKTVPHWEFAGPAAKALTHSLHDYCLRKRIGKAAAAKRIAIKGRF
jgi:hypothetical protein